MKMLLPGHGRLRNAQRCGYEADPVISLGGELRNVDSGKCRADRNGSAVLRFDLTPDALMPTVVTETMTAPISPEQVLRSV